MIKEREGLVVPVRPDWSGPVQIEYEFLTWTKTNFDGSEQRHALRSSPRVKVSHAALSLPEEQRRLWSDLAARQDRLHTLPLRWRYLEILEYSVDSSGAEPVASVVIPDIPFWLEPGIAAVLSSPSREFATEIVSVETVEETDVGGAVINTYLVATLGSVPAVAFDAGDRLLFAYEVWFSDGPELQALTGRHLEADFDWTVDPAARPNPVPGVSPAQYGGYDILDMAVDWSRSPSYTFESSRRTFDVGRGRLQIDNPRAFNPFVMEFGFTSMNRPEAEQLLAFFFKQKGKRGAFFLPTFRDDIQHTGGSSGATTLIVPDPDNAFRETYSGHAIYNTLYARFADGTTQIVRIEGMGPGNPGETVVVVADQWDQDFDGTARIAWCPLVRFAADRMQMRWITDSVAETRVAVRALKNEEAE